MAPTSTSILSTMSGKLLDGNLANDSPWTTQSSGPQPEFPTRSDRPCVSRARWDSSYHMAVGAVPDSLDAPTGDVKHL